MSHSEVLEDFYQRVWVHGDTSAVDRFFVPDLRADGLMPDLALTPSEFQTLVQAVLALVEEPQVEIAQSIEDGDWLSALVHVRCVSRETGAPLQIHGQVMMRFDGDRIVEAYNHFDMLGLFVQIGALPPEAVERALSGEAMA